MCSITGKGAEHLAVMLKTNQSLTLLGLPDNRVGDRGVQSLANVLAGHNTDLQYLYFHKNNSVTD
jgi:hypothetical protein